MVKPGGKKSRNVLFEDVDIDQWKESGDKCFSFTTSEENLPYWISCLQKIYKSTDNDIIWSYTKQSGKLMAQIQEALGNKDANAKRIQSLLCISFFTSTQRILLQGNSCLSWYENHFRSLKEDVYESKITTPNSCSIEVLIKDLPKNEISKNDEIEITNTQTDAADETEKTQNVADKDLIEAADDQVTDRLPEIYLTPSKRRSLPESPSKSHDNRVLINSLKFTISKLVKENVELTSNLHNVSMETAQLRSENESRKLEINDLTNLVKDMKLKLDQLNEKPEKQNFVMNIEETEENNKKFHELKKSMDSLNTDINTLFTRNRLGAEISDEIKSNHETINDNMLDLKNNMTELKSRITNLEDATNSIQEQIFQGEDVLNKSKRTLDVTDEDSKYDKQPRRVFREIKRNGRNTVLIYGDSNTKGLDKNKLKTDINSLSGGTIDSAILHMKEYVADTDESVKGVIFHLGTNNMSNSTESLKDKISDLHDITSKKFPKATIGMCTIPKQNDHEKNAKISEINDFIDKQENLHLIQVFCDDKHFQKDGIHYNKHGLAILAMNIKKWLFKNGLRQSTNMYQQHRHQNVSSPSAYQRNNTAHFNPFPNWLMHWPQMWNGYNTNSLK